MFWRILFDLMQRLVRYRSHQIHEFRFLFGCHCDYDFGPMRDDEMRDLIQYFGHSKIGVETVAANSHDTNELKLI